MRSQAGSRIVVTPIGGRRLAASDLLLRRLAQYPVEDRANERQQQDGDDPPRLGLTREGAIQAPSCHWRDHFGRRQARCCPFEVVEEVPCTWAATASATKQSRSTEA